MVCTHTVVTLNKQSLCLSVSWTRLNLILWSLLRDFSASPPPKKRKKKKQHWHRFHSKPQLLPRPQQYTLQDLNCMERWHREPVSTCFRGKHQQMFAIVFSQQQHLMETNFPSTVVFSQLCVINLLCPAKAAWSLWDGSMYACRSTHTKPDDFSFGWNNHLITLKSVKQM